MLIERIGNIISILILSIFLFVSLKLSGHILGVNGEVNSTKT